LLEDQLIILYVYIDTTYTKIKHV